MGRDRNSSSNNNKVVALFLSIIATFYVLGRLWSSSREIRYLRSEIQIISTSSSHRQPSQEYFATTTSGLPFQEEDTTSSPSQHHPSSFHSSSDTDILFYSIRPQPPLSQGIIIPTFNGPPLQQDSIITDPPTASSSSIIIGQVDRIEAGVVHGWACYRPLPSDPKGNSYTNINRSSGNSVHIGDTLSTQQEQLQPLVVHLYVDGMFFAETEASMAVQYLPSAKIIRKLCHIYESSENSSSSDSSKQEEQVMALGFQAQLPPLELGRHQLRVFALSPDKDTVLIGNTNNDNGNDNEEIKSKGYKRELNHSPLYFKESDVQPDAEEMLRRKDAIILLRNAQLSAMWNEVHTQQPWRDALIRTDTLDYTSKMGNTSSDDGGGNKDANNHNNHNNNNHHHNNNNSSRLVVAIAINTAPDAVEQRARLRRTWVPSDRQAAAELERTLGVAIRFVIGRATAAQIIKEVEKALDQEQKQYGDIVRLDMDDSYHSLSTKTVRLFSDMPTMFDADFYFKIDDDVAVNIPEFAEYLDKKRSQGNLYLGCMKSGQVLTESKWKWHEPEHWRFGEAADRGGKMNYPRHASGQIYGLSRPLALYIQANQDVLHKYANEDVGLGAWMLGLNVEYVNERRLCCDSEKKCAAQKTKDTVCLAYNEIWCAGICEAEKRLEPIWQRCLSDPYNFKPTPRPPPTGTAVADTTFADTTTGGKTV